jgi:hypothetical protein
VIVQNPKKMPVSNKWLIAAYMMLFASLIMATAQVHAETSMEMSSRLWEKAADYMAHNHWVPGRIIEHERTFDLKNKVQEETRFVLGFSPGKQSSIQLRLLAAEKNGKDISNQVRSTINGKTTLEELVGDNPFFPIKGQQVTSRLNGQHRRINGCNCSGFTFIYRTANKTIEGTAWLDQKTGLPVEIHSMVTSVPFTEKDVKIAAFKNSEHFTITPNGHCLLTRNQAEIDIEVPKINFKGRVINDSVCKDHWKYVSAQ